MEHVNIPQSAVIYARISDDREGASAGVARQEADARALADRLGWSVSEVVIENDTSAYKRRKVSLPNGRTELRVVRPGFRRLLDLIAVGDVDGLIAYDLDRTARDPRDLEDLIDAVESRHPRLPVESVTGSLRLANDSDVTMARVMVAVANKASRDSSRRIKRKHEELAQAGKYAGGGARRYGYERDGVTVREDEAEVIRLAASRVLAGESATSICKDFDEQCILPVSAQSWSSRALLDILRSPRIAGLRVHRGEVVGPAQWPAIIDQDTHEALLAELNTRSRGAGKPALRHWCNGLLWCGRCGHYLSAAYVRAGVHRYWCHPKRGGCGRIAIGMQVETELESQVLGYLTRPNVLDTLARGRTETLADDTRSAIAEDEAQLRTLSRMWAEKQITLDEFAEARTIIERRIKSARGALLAVVPDRVRAVLSSSDVAETWRFLEPSTRREVAQAILHPLGFKGWTVAPAEQGRPRRFDPDRLDLAPTDDTPPTN
jgi:site-specific DNA recombinase